MSHDFERAHSVAETYSFKLCFSHVGISNNIKAYTLNKKDPANIGRWPNVDLLLADRLRRWPNSKAVLDQHIMVAGNTYVMYG